LYILIAIVLITLIALILIFIFLKRKFRKRRKFFKSNLELAKEKILNIDYNDTKDIVYTFSTEVAKFIDEKNQDRYNQILQKLDIFKYKKEVPQMDESLKQEIKEFIKGIKWRV